MRHRKAHAVCRSRVVDFKQSRWIRLRRAVVNIWPSESGGDDRFFHVPKELKKLRILQRDKASPRFEELLKSLSAVLVMLRKPPSSIMKRRLKIYVSDPIPCLLHPDFCALTVITVSHRSILDGKRRQLISKCCARVMARGRWEMLLKAGPYNIVRK